MKILIVLALVAVATTGNCFPGANRSPSDDDVELLPVDRRHDPFKIIDLDASNPYDDDDFPGLGQGWKDGFSAFMKRVSDLVKNVRTQVAKDFEDKLKNGNTTSTVEIINGHRVVKNQTVYQDPHTFVKSVIFEVLPNDDETTSGPTESQPEADIEPVKKPKDREPLEESAENEVNALNEDENFNIETLEDNNLPSQNFAYKEGNADNEIESFEIIEPESIKNIDIKNINTGLSNIETLDSNEIPLPDEPKFNDGNSLNNVESLESFKPIDLSNDVRVNDILRDQGYMMNPDAEIIDLDVPKLVVT